MLQRGGFGSEKAITVSNLRVAWSKRIRAEPGSPCWDALPILQKPERSEMGERCRLPSPPKAHLPASAVSGTRSGHSPKKSCMLRAQGCMPCPAQTCPGLPAPPAQLLQWEQGCSGATPVPPTGSEGHPLVPLGQHASVLDRSSQQNRRAGRLHPL